MVVAYIDDFYDKVHISKLLDNQYYLVIRFLPFNAEKFYIINFKIIHEFIINLFLRAKNSHCNRIR